MYTYRNHIQKFDLFCKNDQNYLINSSVYVTGIFEDKWRTYFAFSFCHLISQQLCSSVSPSYLMCMYISTPSLICGLNIEKKSRFCGSHIIIGANIASPMCHGSGCFFAQPRKSVHTYFGRPVTKTLESPMWHWLILPPIGANAHNSCLQVRTINSTAFLN